MNTRIGDDGNKLVLFVNKSRADLCTQEQLDDEQVMIKWLNSDREADPPAEPDAGRQGVNPVRATTLKIGQSTTTKFDGRNLPVEVWRLEDEVDGIDCSATEAPAPACSARAP